MALNMQNAGFLDLAYRLQCTLLFPSVYVGRYGERYHSNRYRHGRVGSEACHCFVTNGCRSCRRELGQGQCFTQKVGA